MKSLRWLGLHARGTVRRRHLFAVGVLGGAVSIAASLLAIVDGLWLRPLPFGDPDRLVRVSSVTEWNRRATAAQLAEMAEALANDPRVVASARAVEGELSERRSFELDEGGLFNYRVTPSFFSVLGIAPSRGRVLLESDIAREIVPAVIADSLWRSRWGSDPAIIGRIVELGATRLEIVGVMPSGFTFPFGTSLWTPLGDSGPLIPTLVRLADDVPLTALAQAYRSLDFIPLEEFYRPQQHAAVTFIAISSAILFLTVVANLMALRVVDLTRRIRDDSIRQSLGATAKRLSLDTGLRVAALTGAALLLAWIVIPSIVPFVTARLPLGLARHTDISYTWRTIFCSVALALAGAIAFHWPANRRDVAGQAAQRRGVRHSMSFHALIVALLVAAGTALTYVAILATVSVGNLQRSELGFEPTDVLEVQFPRRLADQTGDRQRVLHQRWLEIQDLPAVVSVALASGRPLMPSWIAGTARIPGNPACEPATVRVNYVTPDYFRTLQVRILAGDVFGSSAAASGLHASALPPDLLLPAVVNEALIRHWRSCGAAIGAGIQVTSFRGQIVAVAGDTVDSDPREAAEPLVYFPAFTGMGSVLLVKHVGSGDGGDRALIQHLSRTFPGADVTPLTSDVVRMQAADRGRAFALQFFCGLSLLVAAAGLIVNQAALIENRRHEFALRLALGADAHHVRRRIVLPAALGTLAGTPAGVLLGIASGRLGESLLVGVPAVYDRGVYGVVTMAAAIALGVAASGVPAVLRISPATALKETP